jgi:UDP-2,4-diacetamido-2,4,6-trideoxy-beta-L-altropyranose hydrolase
MKYIVYRVDASASIGTGHVMRCLTLADALKSKGYESIFICQHLVGNVGTYIEGRGFRVELLEKTADIQTFQCSEDAEGSAVIINGLSQSVDWLIVDHYEIDHKWEKLMKPHVNRIMVIDDLANRAHQCDLLLDQNLQVNGELRYRNLVPPHCKLLIGPRYLLLRPSFYESKRLLSKRNRSLEKLLIFFGGSDPTNETIKALQALADMNLEGIQITVIIGVSNPNAEQIVELCLGLENVQLHVQVENMTDYIVQADFALGAGGVAMWERCYLGLPSSVTIVADNQQDSVIAAERSGAVWNLGRHEQTNNEAYRTILRRALSSPNELVRLSIKAKELFSNDQLHQLDMPVLREILAFEDLQQNELERT